MGDKSKIEWTDWNAEIWRGLRLPVRIRLAGAFDHLLKNGTLNRADIIRIGEVSLPTAAGDIRIMQERTGALVYDVRAKCYRLKENTRHG